jgi:WD40 repeat protein
MRRVSLALLVAVALALAVPMDVQAAGPPPKERFDLYGDPLPAGAIARLGSLRWRLLNGFHQPVLSPDGRWLISSEVPPASEMYLWDTATGRLERTLDAAAFGEGELHCRYAFLPDGKRLLSHDLTKGTFSLWDFPSFLLVKRWRGACIDSLVVSHDGRLAAGAFHERVDVHNLRTGKRQCLKVDLGKNGGLVSLAFTRDGTLVVMKQIIERSERQSLHTFTVLHIDRHTRQVRKRLEVRAGLAVLSPDGRHLVTSNRRDDLWLYSLETGKKRRLAMDAESAGPWLYFRSDGRRLVMVDDVWRLAWTWDVNLGELIDRIRLAPCFGETFLGQRASSFLLSPNGKHLFTVGRNAVTRMSLRTGKPVGAWAGAADPVDGFRWSADGRTIEVEAMDDRAKWDARTGRFVGLQFRWRMDTVLGGGEAWAYSPDGWLFAREDEIPREGAETSEHRHILVFDVRTGDIPHELRGRDSRAVALGFNPSGRLLASVESGGTICLWDLKRGRLSRTMDASKIVRNVKGLLFRPDGRQLVLVEGDGRLHLWDVRTGKHTTTLRPAVPMPAEQGTSGFRWSRSVFTKDGNRLFLLREGGLRGWDLAAGRELPPFETPELDRSDAPYAGGVSGLSVSADGRFLARVEGGLWLQEVASGKVIHRFPGLYTAAAFHPARLRLAGANEKHLDTLIWDLKTLFLSLSAARPGRQTLPELWADLADRDAGRAHRTVWRLVETPGMARYFGRRLKPIARVDPAWVKQRIADLGSDDFATRRKAEQALAAVVDIAQVALREGHAQTRDLEQRLRMGRLLALLNVPSQDRLREHRAILALEARGTPQARRLLDRLARGAQGAQMTEEAKAALRRLAKRRY